MVIPLINENKLNMKLVQIQYTQFSSLIIRFFNVTWFLSKENKFKVFMDMICNFDL